MAPPITLKRVSPIHKAYFLYIDPILALTGAFIIVNDPQQFLTGAIPGNSLSTHPITITPPIQNLLTNTASLYVLIAVLLGGVLRLTNERNAWLGILSALLVADLGHLYAAYVVAPEHAFNVGGWNSHDWVGYGSLIVGASLRLSFLAGIGRD